MSEANRKYQPIACGFHDLLQHFSVLRKKVEVVWVESGKVHQAEAILVDVYTRDGAEFLLLGTGEIIRLDHIISVDGQSPEGGFCLV